MTQNNSTGFAFHDRPPPSWAITERKTLIQSAWDLTGAPFRMILLPDHFSEKLHLTSLRSERLRMVLPELRGRVLDIGCGDNMLLKLYGQKGSKDSQTSVGADIHQWTPDVFKIRSSAALPFEDGYFDTICYIACLNHIPERAEALQEARRVLRPGGRLIITMIGNVIGKIGHALWWYSEDKQRELHPDELMGMNTREVIHLMKAAKFDVSMHKRFCYGLNNLYIGEKTT